MKITETHKDFGNGLKGRLTIRDDADNVVATIFTTVQKARRFCEANPDSLEGRQFAAAVARASGDPAVNADISNLGTDVCSIPLPPVLEGKNPDNTALQSAQRKLAKLHEAAMSADPVTAVLAIPVSRGNKYLNTCWDYRVALLVSLGYVEQKLAA